jgi:predicted nucleic acid-binding protein
MYDEGIKILQPVIKIPLVLALIAILYGKKGKREEAQKILEDLLGRSKHGFFSPLLIATIYGSLENKDKAFEWLEKGFEERDTSNVWIKVEPVIFDNLRSDTRWTKLMEKMGLAY